ncbi:hypothetical protein ACP8HI_13525 [Paenibacillus sp. FA6]|uniref:hypothetical protein n=1 Tax=Paenibacillus sp. FA6 TaxID=3413029 RepID=UPI003F65EF85
MEYILPELMANYDTHKFNEVMRVIARINEKEVFNGEYDVRFYCDTNYRSVDIAFPIMGKLPLQYLETEGNKFPVKFSYNPDRDQLEMSGKINKPHFEANGGYDIFIQLPQKKYNL